MPMRVRLHRFMDRQTPASRVSLYGLAGVATASSLAFLADWLQWLVLTWIALVLMLGSVLTVWRAVLFLKHR